MSDNLEYLVTWHLSSPMQAGLMEFCCTSLFHHNCCRWCIFLLVQTSLLWEAFNWENAVLSVFYGAVITWWPGILCCMEYFTNKPSLKLSEFQMVKFLTYILLQMTREMSSLLNNFIYHLYIVPLHYTHLRQLIILITTDMLVMTHTRRLISVSPSLLQSGLRSMVSLYLCYMLFISPIDDTNSTNVLCNYLTILLSYIPNPSTP